MNYYLNFIVMIVQKRFVKHEGYIVGKTKSKSPATNTYKGGGSSYQVNPNIRH